MVELSILFELSKSIIPNGRFDVLLHTSKDFIKPETRVWHGRIWADLTSLVPYSTSRNPIENVKKYAGPIPIFEGSIEQLLHLIFTRYENREFSEGVFVLKAEYGADWFTPILQHPHCIIRYSKRPIEAISSKDAKPCTDAGGHVVFYLGPNVKDFCAAFHPIGIIPGINGWSAVMVNDEDLNMMPQMQQAMPQQYMFPSYVMQDVSNTFLNNNMMPNGGINVQNMLMIPNYQNFT